MRTNRILLILLTLATLSFLTSCVSYRRSLLFRTDESINLDKIAESTYIAQKNYKIQPLDHIELKVYTNFGEVLIDPNSELNSELTKGGMGKTTTVESTKLSYYTVRESGYATLPLLGEVYIAGYTTPQLDSVLGVRYAEYYENPFVKSRLNNRRVIVISGKQGGKVIPIDNENINLVEAITLAGLDHESDFTKIRLIRGDLKDPYVQLINLNTIEGLKKADLRIFPGDIIYVEPLHKPVPEILKDYSPIVTLGVSVLTLLFLLGVRFN